MVHKANNNNNNCNEDSENCNPNKINPNAQLNNDDQDIDQKQEPDQDQHQKDLPPPSLPPNSTYCNRRTWISVERMNSLRKLAQEAVHSNKTFTIRGCFNSVRNALTSRGWVEKLDVHRKHIPSGTCQVTYEDIAQNLPKRKFTESRRQYILKCERSILSRFLEHVPIDFLWTARKEKCDYIDLAKNPLMMINKIQRVPFTSKEGLCSNLKDFHWFYEEGISELFFPRCFNAWSPEELAEFIDNFKITACISFIKWMVDSFTETGYDAVFSSAGKVPFNAIEFAFKRCNEYVDACNHHDIDLEEPPHVWEHDWDAFLTQQHSLANRNARILADPQRLVENLIKTGCSILENVKRNWPQYCLDGYQNIWIIKPANKCRGRGIQLMDNLKKIMAIINPSVASKSRFVIQKYIERPLIIHNTKFDIRQWFLITNVQPLVLWMYKESYIRFSSQEYSLSNHHESVHLTNHAIQKKYTNGKRDKRLPTENMWDCYSFQAYLRQIGKHEMWAERIYPGMRKAIIGTALASQDNIERRQNTFELFGADFMVCENFYPWLIEVNASPDFGATTSVTARMCPQCLEDVVRVVVDRKNMPKADTGNFELIYRQIIPPSPAYMGLNLSIKGKQLLPKTAYQQQRVRRERAATTIQYRRILQSNPQVNSLSVPVTNMKEMPTFNATENLERVLQTRASKRIEAILGISPRDKDKLSILKDQILFSSKNTSPRKQHQAQNHIEAYRLALKSGPAASVQSPLTPKKRLSVRKSCDPRGQIESQVFDPKSCYSLLTSPKIGGVNQLKNNITNLLNKSETQGKSRRGSAKSLKKHRFLSTQSVVAKKQQVAARNSNSKKRKTSLELPPSDVKSFHAVGKGFLAWKSKHHTINRSAPLIVLKKDDKVSRRLPGHQNCPNT
ncbi:tubulin glycylase 3A [Eupeodes corollae]|uniref:tubulin glycylase 3A n=1 Tax=Eupeodes corollae TaxID=290404 RepID=UPI00249051FA|nr:tubulin glycylase 3A [Eupeodes corollae]